MGIFVGLNSRKEMYELILSMGRVASGISDEEILQCVASPLYP
jgi:hypothetical protein